MERFIISVSLKAPDQATAEEVKQAVLNVANGLAVPGIREVLGVSMGPDFLPPIDRSIPLPKAGGPGSRSFSEIEGQPGDDDDE